MRRRALGAALCAVLFGPGCQTSREGVADPRPPVLRAAAPVETSDRLDDLTAPIVVEPGSRYPNLLASESFAVLLEEETMLSRARADARLFGYGEGQLAIELQQARNLAREFILCEVHLASSFGDVAIAADAVTLRAFRLSLADDEGRAVGPALIQPATEQISERPSSIQVSGVSLVLFPRHIADNTRPLLGDTTQRLRLVLQGLDSRFVAEWRLSPSFRP